MGEIYKSLFTWCRAQSLNFQNVVLYYESNWR